MPGPGGPSDNPPVEHLRAAALEFVRAGQILLALAEKTLEDPSSGVDVIRRLADTGREFFTTWTGPGSDTGGEGGEDGGVAESGVVPAEGHGDGGPDEDT